MRGKNGLIVLPWLIAAAFVLSACGPLRTSSSPEPTSERGSDDLTLAELTDYSTVMEAVQALRPLWLRERTPLVLSPQTGAIDGDPVWVYWDGTRLGDTSYLTRIATADVSRVMHYNAAAASFRWGMNHENGVIYLVPAVGSVGPVSK